MILSFPQGLFLDRFGEVPTRLGAGCVYTLGEGNFILHFYMT